MRNILLPSCEPELVAVPISDLHVAFANHLSIRQHEQQSLFHGGLLLARLYPSDGRHERPKALKRPLSKLSSSIFLRHRRLDQFIRDRVVDRLGIDRHIGRELHNALDEVNDRLLASLRHRGQQENSGWQRPVPQDMQSAVEVADFAIETLQSFYRAAVGPDDPQLVDGEEISRRADAWSLWASYLGSEDAQA
jgi:hypothetical protein